MIRRIKTEVIVLALLASAFGSAGCATQGEKMISSYADTRDTLARANSQVDRTMAALSAVRTAPAGASIQHAFNEYKDQIAKLEQEGEAARQRAAAMKGDAEAHIKAWQKEQAQISDPQIKATLESRQQAVRTNFSLLQMYAGDVRTRFGPFLQRNKDIVQALSIDLSPQAVSSLSGTIDGVMKDGAALSERMSTMNHALANITEGRSAIE